MALGENSVKGTEFKLNINMIPIDGKHLSDVEWKVEVFTETSHKTQIIKKEDAHEIDRDNYIICVDSTICGAGRYFVTLTAYIPDTDFKDGFRTEKRTMFSGVTIDAR